MTIPEYIESLNKRYKQDNSTEHTFRPDLQNLLETILPDIQITNEPTRIKCGAPDYILTKKEIPIGYIEAKDLGADLNNKSYKEQFTRYKEALPNLIITNYLDFQVYKNGELITTYSIGSLVNGSVIGKPDQYDTFTALIKDFSAYIGQTIKSAQKLAVMMANKAKILASVIGEALDSDVKNTANSTLQEQYRAFKDILIHDITARGFADIYAQTIAYGMFAARLHDPTLNTFTRQEAAELIPKTNPFLRKLFQYIAGYDLDTRIIWIVDALADIFRATDIKAILKNFGKATKQHDPIIHFYETFLKEYDPKLRIDKGVWYTPEPVVNFIVRAVDDILKTEFGLKDGLADTSKVKIKRKAHSKASADRRSKIKEIEVEEEVHRVQILDPATGTGTFLAEVIRQIHEKFSGQQGIWSSYVEHHLIPRINGFELLMASYAMAHLKLDMLLTETGYKARTDQRLNVYLTNSLEEFHPYIGELPFAGAISDEANQANQVKRDTPVMTVIGNPPYLGESKNKGEWITSLMEVYKREPGGQEKLKERNPKWINADENKFIRFGQYLIEKNGFGILAYINPHTYLDNPTLRGMRWNLSQAFDKIYILDLHGNAKKKEVSPNGDADINVFDIRQGVCINIFIKTGYGNKANEAEVFHYDLFGRRENKYQFLLNNSIDSIPFKKISIDTKNCFFIPKDFEEQKEYETGFKLNDLFLVHSLGIQTHRDKLVIDINKENLEQRINRFYANEYTREELKSHYNVKDTSEWKLEDTVKGTIDKSLLVKIDYRLFDTRWIYYSKDVIDRDRKNVMKHFLRDNLALSISKQQSSSFFQHVFVSKHIQESCLISLQTKEQGYAMPLYQYNAREIFDSYERKPNLNENIVAKFSRTLGLVFKNEKEDTLGTFAPIDLFDYIYAVLHSPIYREKYKEFLKIDFPRIPYPTNTDKFWQLVTLGAELRQIHLLVSPIVTRYITKYPVDGGNIVDKPLYKDNKVWINSEQYFEGVPEVAWDFYIGGYQPAQKWLKDRKGRELNIEDILHYQKIIVALTETNRIMKEIDKIEIV